MHWIFIALLEPILHALVNILDSNLTNRLFKNVWVLTVLVAACDLLFLPLIWIIDPPAFPKLNLWPFFIIIAFIELLYTYPYYKALQNDDTSVAISLFSLGKIFVPLLAFLFIGESLRPLQYAGFFLIVISSAALTFNPTKRLHLNISFFYMLLSSSLLAVEVVVYKHIFNQVSWGTGFFWVMGLSALIGLFTLFLPQISHNAKQELARAKQHYRLILLVGGLSFFGNVGFSYAVSQVPATISRVLDSFQPFFIVLYALIFIRIFPNAFKEELSMRKLAKKIVFFLIILVGAILAVG